GTGIIKLTGLAEAWMAAESATRWPLVDQVPRPERGGPRPVRPTPPVSDPAPLGSGDSGRGGRQVKPGAPLAEPGAPLAEPGAPLAEPGTRLAGLLERVRAGGLRPAPDRAVLDLIDPAMAPDLVALLDTCARHRVPDSGTPGEIYVGEFVLTAGMEPA